MPVYSPETATGTRLSPNPPFPSWPPELDPQQYAFPITTPQEWSPPAPEPSAREAEARTYTGTRDLSAVEPMPSWPFTLDPQQRSSPPTMAQEWSPPAATAVTPVERP